MLDAVASYIDFGDLAIVTPWLSEEQATRMDALKLDGVVRGLEVTISEMDSDQPRFNINAELENIGFDTQRTSPACAASVAIYARVIRVARLRSQPRI